MENTEQTNEWLFRFGFEKEDGSNVPRELADELLETIRQWAEAHGCQIGGGYRIPNEDDLKDYIVEM